ncbi:MAG: polyketide-type polyunsaturated fatty acid synthase PfaA, partial [Gammaproteobacteria bacterium]|nr:polyketide-type polyunsaturated fatty acid synthase PfaA [Gammaproteobacteria bacterium]
MHMLTEKSNFLPHYEIAVVGMAGLFPEASDTKEFWNNILSKKNCIREIGNDWQGYWRPEDYYDADPKTPDKVYSKKAGLIPEIEFDPLEFNMPPMNLEATSQDQLYSLFAAKKAFQDSSLLNYSDRSRIGVILGVAEVGNIGFYLATRTEYQSWRRVLENFDLPEEMISAIIERLKNLYPKWQENSLPGFLGNVVCGRITHYFNLGGPNYSVSAACASSLAAIKAAINELVEGTCDAVLTGGVNIDTNSAFAFTSFTKTPVISQTGCIRPYDQDSNGIMLGDAVGMIILKRLKDAERDGDKIYGVIKSVGVTSDGKGDSIYAPKLEGQIRTLKQAYEKSGCSFETIGLVEGHGTGTVAGDFCEFQALNTIFKEAPKQSIALGSIKSQIGHTRIAAGAASMIKALIALDNKILPPTINVSTPNPRFQIEHSAFYLNTEARPWIHSERKGPRRAAVSSFGFGGTNFHVVLEEYTKAKRFGRFAEVPDILLIQASTVEKLIEKCQKLVSYFRTNTARQHYQDYLKSIKNIELNSQWPRIGFVASSITEC